MLLLRVLHLPDLLLDLRVTLCFVHLLAHFRILQPPLLDFMDFSQFFFPSSLIYLVLDLVSDLLLFGKILLVQLVELLPLPELSLLLLELLAHAHLPIASRSALLLRLLVRPQHGVLVQCSPFVDFVLQPANFAIGVLVCTVLLLSQDTKVLLQPLLEQGSGAGQALRRATSRDLARRFGDVRAS